MKVFVSWSGELSCKIAEVLKKWLPCIIQNVEVFYSPEDIEKGENWDKTISSELSNCNYGIICLTSDNTTAPWINFEAGALAKSLDSRVTALMVNVKPSDIKGPLSRYQGTKFEKNDFFQLVTTINKLLDTPLDNKVLLNTFDSMWVYLEKDANEVIKNHSNSKMSHTKREETTENEPLEEILQLLRTQNTILTDPSKLLPVGYLDFIKEYYYKGKQELYDENDVYLEELIRYVRSVLINLDSIEDRSFINEIVQVMCFEEFLQILSLNVRNKSRNVLVSSDFLLLKKKYYDIVRTNRAACEQSNDYLKTIAVKKGYK